MDPKLAQELAEFKKKKDDVFKNINLLNSLSETLVSTITDEETKIIQKKNKDFIWTTLLCFAGLRTIILSSRSLNTSMASGSQ